MLVIQTILLCLSATIHHILAEQGKCHPPQLDNGVVEAEEGAGGNFFKGEFRCNPGFTLSGPTTLKCRNGVWSGSMPVCSVSGCDPNKLPTIVNGRRIKVKRARNSVFKYKCNRGYRLFGPKNVFFLLSFIFHGYISPLPGQWQDTSYPGNEYIFIHNM